MGKLNDYQAGFISQETYQNDQEQILIDLPHSDERIIWKTVDIIEDEDTGLYGYVLENAETNEVVISFRGTEMDKGLSEMIKDFDEDLNGVVLGDSDYTDVYEVTEPYTGSRAQIQSLYAGRAKYDVTEQSVTYTNKNQFSEAEAAVKKYVDKYGAENITFTGHSLGGGIGQYCAVVYDSNAVTFAAADAYGLLSEEQQKRVREGDYKDNIITYAYPSDAVSMFHDKTIGSLYYMEDPAGKDGLGDQFADMLGSHGIKNYTDKTLYNEDGYYKSDLLFDEKLRAAISTSPLFLKNSGVSDFPIVIQTELMKSYAAQVEASEDLIAKTKKEMMQFLDDYLSAMEYAKSKFKGQVGAGRYDKLNGSDVDDIYRDLTVSGPNGIPMLFEMDYFDEVIEFLKDAQSDTGEIAHNMNKMAKDFAHIDEMLAGWLRF
ncbi:Lipase (class 3) [Terribacillus saccharophilus]|uniref:Lipase (Class 3) n=1 Tax=Terribacillus saccharophilus TaxID=361277 RepID=A0AAX2EI69_9BACI|nr:Lipase (class 3) [Terribacillus saccharophilus]